MLSKQQMFSQMPPADEENTKQISLPINIITEAFSEKKIVITFYIDLWPISETNKTAE